VSHQLQSIIEDNQVSQYADLNSVTMWINKIASLDPSFGPACAGVPIFKANIVEAMATHGLGSDEGIDKVIGAGAGVSKEKLLKKVRPHAARLFYKDDASAEDAVSELASRMMLRSVYSQPLRYLHLGTIIRSRTKGEYFLCMQPLCDSVRITSDRSFPFLTLVESTGQSVVDFVVRNAQGSKWVHLSSPRSPHNIVMMDFAPSARLSVDAQKIGRDNFAFKDGRGIVYVWVGELTQEMAQRAANELGNQYSRVGVDEVEVFRHRRT